MNKELFLEQLERLLSELPSSEREEAMEYYRNYFEDAGVEEEKVIVALGNPALVAKQIKENFQEDTSTYEYSENGFTGTSDDTNTKVSVVREVESTKEKTSKKTNTTNRILLIIIGILTVPIWLPLLITVVAVMFAILVSVMALGMGLFATGAGIGLAAFLMIVVGFLLLFIGIFKVFTIPLAGIMMVGIACAIIGVSILLFWLILSGMICFVPACIRGIVWLCKLPFRGMRTV
ncbi:MAG: DUF1700 domain-containing protein [Eubacteriales bacterium]